MDENLSGCDLFLYYLEYSGTDKEDSGIQIGGLTVGDKIIVTETADELFFFNLFKVQVTPTTLLVDKKGIIRYWEEGTSESKRAYLLDRLKELSVE